MRALRTASLVFIIITLSPNIKYHLTRLTQTNQPTHPPQEELDQEARELGEEAVRSYNRARPGQGADADAFAAIARSNAAAVGGDGAWWTWVL